MPTVKLEIQEGIAIVTLDNPPVNALGAAGQVQIYETFDRLHEQSEARVVIFTGAGGRAFCAGADIRARIEGDPGFPEDHGRRAREAFNSIYECPLPVIGAINGPALGAGLALAASCDYLLASDNANFGLPEIDVGLMGGARHLGRLFPQQVTRRLHYTADRLTATEAYRLGAVHKVVPPDQLMDAAIQEARIIAAKMPMGIRFAKEGLNMIEWMDLKNGYRFKQTRTAILRKTEDAVEAKKAFLEKRPPLFKGR